MRQPSWAVLAGAGLFLAVGSLHAGGVDTGSADFERFVALGDSLVAGESSGSLVAIFQETSLPLLVYRQVRGSANGFEQPLVSQPGNPGRLALCPDLSLVQLPGFGQPLSADLPRPFDNLGLVGGARLNDLLTIGDLSSCAVHPITQAGLKDCFRLDLTLRGGGTALDQALSLDPTFALLWVGSNDALAAAATGTVVEGITLTPAASFEADYRAVVSALASAGVQVVLGTVPDVTLLPLVTTIPPVVVDPATLRPVSIGGETVPLLGPGGLPLSGADRVTLFAQPYLAAGCGIPDTLDKGFDPQFCKDGYLPGEVILDATEAAEIRGRIDEFNAAIREAAEEHDAALYDAAAALREAAREGITIGGIAVDTSFLTGGLIGYDGVHPTSLGHAVLANGFLEAINEHHDAEIPLVDLSPFLFGPAGSFPPVNPALCSGVTVSTPVLRAISRALAVPSLVGTPTSRPSLRGSGTRRGARERGGPRR